MWASGAAARRLLGQIWLTGSLILWEALGRTMYDRPDRYDSQTENFREAQFIYSQSRRLETKLEAETYK